eukprot:2505048-Prymnesium_polylepis.1
MGAPKAIIVEMPDDPPRGLAYDLQSSTSQELVLFARGTVAYYRLVAVIMYAKNYHFFADVRDPRHDGWFRFDGMEADGVGQPINPPSGRVRHRHRVYVPICAMYLQTNSAPQQEPPQPQPSPPQPPQPKLSPTPTNTSPPEMKTDISDDLE